MPESAGPDHDQRLKVLLKEFFEAFFLCFFPAWAASFEFLDIDWLDKEIFISPLLSNIYLDELDHLMAQRGLEMVRYADDFVTLCRSPEEAAEALALVQQWTAEAGLKLHPEKTKIVDATKDVFDFLGYRFKRGRRFPRPKSLQKLKDAIRAKTRRTSGESRVRHPASIFTSTSRGLVRRKRWSGGFVRWLRRHPFTGRTFCTVMS